MFQTKVLCVRQRHDYSHTGQWEVVTENKDGHKETQVFDRVLVCSGSITHPITPFSAFPGIIMLRHFIPVKHMDFKICLILSQFIFSVSGIDTFPGKCYHSWEYKEANSFHEKRVVVIGSGNSSGDIAVEISRVAERVSTTRELINMHACMLLVFK